ncbi:hypothetical protein [Nonomuraea sp. NPDC049480]|uniref:hypothetical protein n=1 Tax=Nonomuraea sp. NPDC049480 TaxID=3364353 RepID=UPI0037B73CE7
MPVGQYEGVDADRDVVIDVDGDPVAERLVAECSLDVEPEAAAPSVTDSRG